MLSKEDLEIIEEKQEKLSPQQKGARTKAAKYGKNAHAEWGRKGGQARVPKGYSMNPDKTGGRIKQRAMENEYNTES